MNDVRDYIDLLSSLFVFGRLWLSESEPDLSSSSFSDLEDPDPDPDPLPPPLFEPSVRPPSFWSPSIELLLYSGFMFFVIYLVNIRSTFVIKLGKGTARLCFFTVTGLTLSQY